MTIPPLPPDDQQRWDAYLVAERRDTRAEKLAALDRFVEHLLRTPAEVWKPWARAVAAWVVDEGGDMVVRRALFERVLFPALADGLGSGTPGCARWLAGFNQHLYACEPCLARLRGAGLPATEYALLRAAAADDPGDGRARQRLIEVMTSHLDYAIHEVPSGVLYGRDGATVEQCDELMAELDEFRRLLAAEGRTAAFTDLIRACDFHFRTYRHYLTERPAGENYAAFIARRGGGERPSK